MTALRRWLGAGRSCPAGSELTRAASEGPGPRVRAHLERCADCAAEVESLRALSLELAALPEPAVDREAFEQIATALLGATNERAAAPERAVRQHGRWPLALALGGVASILIGGFWLARSRSTSSSSTRARAPIPTRATIHAFGDTRFERLQPAPDERVRLDEGTLELDLPSLGPTETFRVVTMDAEVVAAGAQFELTATSGRLERVRVWSGRVEIDGSRFVVTALERGDQWNRQEPARQEDGAITSERARGDVGAPPALVPGEGRRGSPGVPVRAVALLGVHPARSAPASAAATPEKARFDRAWALLRAGRAAQAAAGFAEAARLARGTALEEDATYWNAVASARAGDGPGAQRELRAFIDRFPRSPHAGEAFVALGWMLYEGREVSSARTFFERAAHDPSARVQQSALKGLQRTAP